jgi:hypothetical protein
MTVDLARSEKGSYRHFGISDTGSVREQGQRRTLGIGEPETQKSEIVWRKASFWHIRVQNFGSFEDKAIEHFGV